MSTYQYRGDSIEKNANRLTAYSILPRFDLYHKKHIVVAGTGGDIQALTALGVPAKNIIASDLKAGYRAHATRLGATVPPGAIGCDITNTTAWAFDTYGAEAIASANVDLCLSLIKGVPILEDTLTYIPEGLPVFFTFLCGHDPGLAKAKDETNPGKARLDFFRKNVSTDHKQVLFHPYQSWTKDSDGSPMCLAICR
jgi:hypothetical protein